MLVVALLVGAIACTSEREPRQPSSSAPAVASPMTTTDAGTPPEPSDWRTHPELRAKVTSPGALDAALARGPASVYARLDAKTAPATTEERRQALAAVGADPQTVSGDLATLRVPAARVGALLALEWVTSLEVASAPKPR